MSEEYKRAREYLFENEVEEREDGEIWIKFSVFDFLLDFYEKIMNFGGEDSGKVSETSENNE